MSFWTYLDKLVSEHRIIIDRPKGTSHPGYPDSIYPYDYGYLENNTGGDGHGIDIWRGSQPTETVQAIICTIDLQKANNEIKIIIGCTPEEINTIHSYHCTFDQQGLLIRRT
jgi:inorganic pyrophosphatase